MPEIRTQPIARQQLNVAPAATIAPPAPAFDTTQWTAIGAAVTRSLAGISAGNTVGNFSQLFEQNLLANRGTNPDGSLFTVGDANALAAGYVRATGESSNFYDQGSSSAPFAQAWTARLRGMFGWTADPVAPVAPAAPKPTPAAPIAPPPVLNNATPNPIGTPANSAPTPAAIPTAAPLPPDPITSSTIAAAIAAALAAGGTPTATATATPAATTTTSSALQTTTAGTSATTATAATPDATTAALLSALAGSSSGLISPDSSVGTPSTAGLQEITPVAGPATTSTTSNPAVTIAIGVALVGAGFVGYEYWKHHHHSGGSAT